MNWDKEISLLLEGKKANKQWDELLKNATTEQHVSDLVDVLDNQLHHQKMDLVEELENGADVAEIEKAFDDLEKEYRVTRSEFDFLYFTYEYFSEDRNPFGETNMIPSGVDISDAPHIHIELCHTLHVVSNVEINKRIVQSMPRGHGKSLFLSNIFPLHQVLFKKRRYQIIISETDAMARKFVEFISEALKHNAKLREDFGEILSPNPNKNPKDNQEGFETLNGCYIQGASIKKQLRGSRFRQYRPDGIVMDDLESSANTNTTELIEKTKEFFNKTVMPIGSPERTCFLYMGTHVSSKGLLNYVIEERADFDSKNYSAIVKEPSESVEYWNEFENIYSDIENKNRMEEALEYYEKHKEIMDSDVETLWNDRFPYYKLMMEKHNLGQRAFNSEFLNKPSSDEDRIFSDFIWFDDKDLYDRFGRPVNLEIYTFWDLAVGKNQRSDYNAIVTIGKDRRTGIIYVLDAWGAKVPMHKAKQKMMQKIAEYKPHTAGVETVQAQFEMYRQLKEDVTKSGMYHTRIKPVNPKGKKEDRIGSLEPLFENGAIRLRKNQRLLIQQLEEFQNGADHDDMPDALASAVNLAGGFRQKRTFLTKPKGL
ncbi:phage terminase large subunit [Halobacillus karajensis]|uniref:phage terminase large subunit n=1 Tax=Halobacillus karajensis TaxID=195088 RepID=UPI00045CFEFB|nr:phage terminase large subunit [Halobacillus karajensis]CDQ21696.1 Terminase-like family protein [Halobacillus karajensis]